MSISRRDALKSAAAGLAASTVASVRLAAAVIPAPTQPRASAPRLRFGVVGISHGHIVGMSDAVIRGGGELVAFHSDEPPLAADFAKRYPRAKQVADERAILEDPSIRLVLSSIVPVQRAPLGIRVMQHGKDYLVDKPGIISLEQLAQVRRVQKDTGRIYSIMYSERF